MRESVKNVYNLIKSDLNRTGNLTWYQNMSYSLLIINFKDYNFESGD